MFCEGEELVEGTAAAAGGRGVGVGAGVEGAGVVVETHAAVAAPTRSVVRVVEMQV